MEEREYTSRASASDLRRLPADRRQRAAAVAAEFATRDAADKYRDDSIKRIMATLDAERSALSVNASRNYDPSPELENQGAGDVREFRRRLHQPAELGSPSAKSSASPRQVRPDSDGRETHGHGTHTWAALWQQYLKELLSPTPN